MDDEMRQVIAKAIEARLAGKMLLCPICGQSQWAMSKGLEIVHPQGLGSGISLGGGEFMPFISLMCAACGFAHRFNLVVLGVWQRLLEMQRGAEIAKKALES